VRPGEIGKIAKCVPYIKLKPDAVLPNATPFRRNPDMEAFERETIK